MHLKMLSAKWRPFCLNVFRWPWTFHQCHIPFQVFPPAVRIHVTISPHVGQLWTERHTASKYETGRQHFDEIFITVVEVVILTTSGAANDKILLKWHFLFGVVCWWVRNEVFLNQFIHWYVLLNFFKTVLFGLFYLHFDVLVHVQERHKSIANALE